MMQPAPVEAGRIGMPEVFGFQLHNFGTNHLDYDQSTHRLEVGILINPRSWYNIGLGMLEVKFNKTHPPIINELVVIYDNETLEDPLDMLKNYTYSDGTYDADSNGIFQCKYLMVWFYLYPNHTVINEAPMINIWGAEYDYVHPITTEPPRPMMTLASSDIIDSDVLFSVPTGNSDDSIVDTYRYLAPVVFAISVVGASIMIVVYVSVRQKKT